MGLLGIEALTHLANPELESSLGVFPRELGVGVEIDPGRLRFGMKLWIPRGASNFLVDIDDVAEVLVAFERGAEGADENSE